MAEKPQNGQNQVEPAEEQDELMKDYDALVISAKDLPPYESDMDTDFSEEFKSDLESLKIMTLAVKFRKRVLVKI